MFVMKRPGPLLVAACVLLLCFAFLPRPLLASSSPMKICIEEGVREGTLTSQGKIILSDQTGKKITVGTSVKVQNAGAGKARFGASVLSLPVLCHSSSLLKWNGKPYRGDIRFQNQMGSGAMAVINVIPVETYLRGVLKMEINPSWPMESIKAQAIVARTYALSHRGKDAARGYDFDNTNRSQVYRGVNAEDPQTDKAISSTCGLVLEWKGKLALTPYHADSGGWTADVRDVWGGERSYLVGSREPFPSGSPYSNWTVTLSSRQVAGALSKMGIDVGTVQSVGISARDAGGRAISLLVRGSHGEATVKANAFRMALGSKILKSTFFQIQGDSVSAASTVQALAPGAVMPDRGSKGEEDLLVQLTQQGAFSTEELMDMLLHPDKREQYLQRALEGKKQISSTSRVPSAKRTSVPLSSQNFMVQGKGWGHGVGMSQWGARAMGLNGWKVREILSHYYPGTVLKKLY